MVENYAVRSTRVQSPQPSRSLLSFVLFDDDATRVEYVQGVCDTGPVRLRQNFDNSPLRSSCIALTIHCAPRIVQLIPRFFIRFAVVLSPLLPDSEPQQARQTPDCVSPFQTPRLTPRTSYIRVRCLSHSVERRTSTRERTRSMRRVQLCIWQIPVLRHILDRTLKLNPYSIRFSVHSLSPPLTIAYLLSSLKTRFPTTQLLVHSL